MVCDFPVPGGPCTTRASWCFILLSIVANFADSIGVEQYYDQISKPRITNYKSISYTPALILRKKPECYYCQTLLKKIHLQLLVFHRLS
jgi:thioredoxin-related protein